MTFGFIYFFLPWAMYFLFCAKAETVMYTWIYMKHEIWTMPSLPYRRKHISAMLNVRGMVHQTDRQEILAVVRDLENSDSSINLPRDHALFSEIAVAKDMSCLGLVLIRFGLTVSSWVVSARPHRNRSRSRRNEKHVEDRPQSSRAKRFTEP